MKHIMRHISKLTLLLGVFALGTGCRGLPAPLPPSERALDVFAGVADVLILRGDGSLWAAGNNQSGQLGVGHSAQRGIAGGDVPALSRVYDDEGAPFLGARFAAFGENHAVILREDGTLWGAGDSSFGELGLRGGRLLLFTRLNAGGVPVSGARAVAAGSNSTFFIDGEDSLWAAGFNFYGELGVGNRDTQFSFTRVEGLSGTVRALASGTRHTALLKEDGALWVAGYNVNGQLGLGDTEDRTVFTEARGAPSGIVAVAAGNHHTVILTDDGSVWAAGSNFWGQLGLPGGGDHPAFTRLTGADGGPLTNVREIAARGDMTLLLMADGSLFLTGNYADPQTMSDIALGVAGSPIRPTFAPLAPPRRAARSFGEVERVILGNNSIYVIDSNGRLWAAGSNRYGQLGFDAAMSSVLRIVEH
ncbi:MAG: hypothetical protein FWC64_03235 [Treponema sp.]|nr:hypothetical protein [Treponema sp.]